MMVTEDGKFDFLLIGVSLGYLDGLDVGCNEGTEIWLSDERFLVTTLGIYDGIDLELS